MTLESKLIALLIGVVMLVSAAGVGFHYGDTYGTNAEKVKDQKAEISRKDAAITTLQDAARDNQKLADKQAEDNKLENQKHEKELSDVRARLAADASRSVPIDAEKFCRRHAPAAAQTAAPGGDGQADAGAAFLPELFAGNLRRLAARADETAADLRDLKARVESAGCFAGSKP